MSLDALIILAGALTALIPFLGFTVAMQMWIMFTLGIIIIGLGIAVRRRGMPTSTPLPRKRKADFVESIPAGVMSHDIESRRDKHRVDEKVS